jgi:hypothetical protein
LFGLLLHLPLDQVFSHGVRIRLLRCVGFTSDGRINWMRCGRRPRQLELAGRVD